MADRFPLIVNSSTSRVEELLAGDNLDLTSNGIIIDGDTGISGQYLKSTGTGLIWDNPGDVYVSLSQTISNKIFQSCSINANSNAIINLPNSSLINPFITVNNVDINLGGRVTTPDTNTTYSISAQDGSSALEKIIRLTAGGSGSGNDDISIVAGNNVSLSRTGDSITIDSSFTDTDTITRLQSATGGALVSGDITIAAGSFTTVSQTGNTITITGQDTNTVTSVRAETGNTYLTGDVTFLGGTQVTLVQNVDAGTGAQTITVNSVDTITRLKGGTDLGAEYVQGDINLIAGTNVTLTQSSQNITITSANDNTVTRIASGTNALSAGDFRFTQAGATTLTQTVDAQTGVITINIESANDDTGAGLGGAGGVVLTGSNFELKNNANLTTNYIAKWDSVNGQLVDSIISDSGVNGTVTIHGSLEVTGTTTTVNSTTLSVADPIIELRRGTNLTGANGGIQVNRTTDAEGVVQSYIQLAWNEAGGYFRTFDGTIARRLVTESEVQTLTNKTLTSPTLTTPNIGAATATSVNGLSITSTASGVLTIANAKTLTVNNSLTFTGTDGISVSFGNGPGGASGSRVAYTSDSLGSFSQTSSSEFRGIISDAVGTGALIFNDNPIVKTGIRTDAATLTFNLINTNAATINAFGAATAVVMGKLNDGTTTINHGLDVKDSVEIGTDATDSFTVNSVAGFRNSDIFLFANETSPIRIGRGNSTEASNTVLGAAALSGLSVTGSQNALFGFESGLGMTSAAENTGFGYQSLRGCFTGSNNVAIGHSTLSVIEGGNRNVAIGRDALGSTIEGNNNVCIGYFAGHAVQGNGNVLIGPAPDEDITNVTYMPPVQSGSNQLVIGSGTTAWIRGDDTFKVTVPNDFTVGGDTVIQGNLEVQGTTTSINSSTIEIDDKNIELAAAVYAQFSGTATSGSAQITDVNSVSGLIVGMNVGQIGSIPVPAGAYIVDIGTTAPYSVTISSNFAASGDGVFEATGPTDLGADGGGLIIKGTTDKTILYDHSRVKKYFKISESIDLAAGKEIAINDQLILDSTTLGTSVVNSSLTSVGTLTGLEVTDTVVGGTGIAKIKAKIYEGCENNFTTSNAGSLTGTGWNIDCSGRNTVLFTTTTSTFNQWEFTGVNIGNSETYTLTLIIDSNAAATYVDACTVDGNPVTNGIYWSGGSPPISSPEIDILTFLFVKDSTGTLRVFGQGNTNFS